MHSNHFASYIMVVVKNAKVPYELTVADLTMPQQYMNSTKISGINLPYNIYLEDKISVNDMLHL